MILLFSPATVLGPLVGLMRLSVTVPVMVALMAFFELDGWSRPVTVGCCGAVLYGALARVPNRRLVCLLANSWFAATLVFARMVWEQYVGAWWATILAAVVTGVLMVLADLAVRGMLVRLASPGDDVAMHMEVHFGVFCGQVETTRPVLLRLANGKGAMLWPGYRYVWRLSQQGYAPIEAGARVKFDGESG